MEFNQFKNEILGRAKKARACKEEYKRAFESETLGDLMAVIKDNFRFAVLEKVIDGQMITENKKEFNKAGMFYNTNVLNGCLLADGCGSYKVMGTSEVVAFDGVELDVFGRSIVYAKDDVFVRGFENSQTFLFDSARGEFSGKADVEAHDYTELEAHNYVRIFAYGRSEVFCSDHCFVEANCFSRVEAMGDSSVSAFGSSSIKLSGSATAKLWGDSKAVVSGNGYFYTVNGNDYIMSGNAIYNDISNHRIRVSSNSNIEFSKGEKA